MLPAVQPGACGSQQGVRDPPAQGPGFGQEPSERGLLPD